MADPDTSPDTGTGAAESQAETSNDSTEQSPADASAVAQVDGAEGDGENPVPYSRFREVNEAKKLSEARMAALVAENEMLKAREPRAEQKPPSIRDRLKANLKPLDPTLAPLEQMELFALETLEKHPEVLDSWFERKFGMPADMAAATLARTTVTTRESIKSQFEAACAERGVDPKDPLVRNMVGYAMDTGGAKSFAEALNPFVKARAKTPPPRIGRAPEHEGVDMGGITRIRTMPKNAKEASALAAQGKSIEHVSVTEILSNFGK